MKRRLVFILIAFLIGIQVPALSYSQSEKVFKTKYCNIYYSSEKDMSDFVWRLSGKRYDFPEGGDRSVHCIDRIVERVGAMLDMRPRNLSVDVHLRHGALEGGRPAYFDYKTKALFISVENTSDGLFAHEMAHAIMNQYFKSPPPSKIQEILAQYVDRNLWSDY